MSIFPKKSSFSTYLPDPAGIFCLVVFLASLPTLSQDLLEDGDTFWHIKAGAVMLSRHTLLDTDIFSHTAFGTPWTAHEWLSEIIMASVHKLAGLEGIVCFFLLIVALSFWLLFRMTERVANHWVTTGCVALALGLSISHMTARPHLLTWLLMLLTLLVLQRGGKWLFILPVMTALWVNLHGGFIIGLVLQAIFILGAALETRRVPERDRPRTPGSLGTPILVFILSLAAVGLNPFGYQLLLFPFQVSAGVFHELIREWQAPDLQTMWPLRWFLLALLLLVSLRQSKVTWTERLLMVFFVNAALTHFRHISLMVIALTPTVAKIISDLAAERSHAWRLSRGRGEDLRTSPISGPLLTMVLAVVLIVSGSLEERSLAFMTPGKLLEVKAAHLHQLTDYLDQNLPEGKMFNEYSLGGYLLYALNPAPKVFIDGRADMYGEKLLQDYVDICNDPSKRPDLLNEYDIDWIVFDRSAALVHNLAASEQWQMVFENPAYAVLQKKTPKPR